MGRCRNLTRVYAMIMLRDRDVCPRSLDHSWAYEQWVQLPADGHRHEVLDGVLYLSTAPSVQHQQISKHISFSLFGQLDEHGVGVTYFAPLAVVMPHCDPVQPDILVVLRRDTGIIGEEAITGVPALLVEIL